MRGKPLDKARRPAGNKAARAQVDDFTSIPGVPGFVAYSLHMQGILTFAQLRAADVSWLHAPVRAAIERWRDG